MERFIMQDLIAWKNRKDRKPLILLGARQVGKTYILKEFGQREFENVAYINCDNNAMAKDLFASDYNIDRILLTIGAITGVNIEAGKTLIIMQGGRIKMRSPPKVLTGNFRPSQLSFFLS